VHAAADDALESLLLELLTASPSGLSEHVLITRVRETGRTGPLLCEMKDNLSLFQAHFLLFHTLYNLREKLWRQRRGHLEINPLKIRLLPYTNGVAGLSERDRLRDYYMDRSNLETTTAEDVDRLLNAFWLKLHKSSHRKEALEALGLEDPVDDTTIKECYRRLAMRHHPDRGGDKQRLQMINAAMMSLKPDTKK